MGAERWEPLNSIAAPPGWRAVYWAKHYDDDKETGEIDFFTSPIIAFAVCRRVEWSSSSNVFKVLDQHHRDIVAYVPDWEMGVLEAAPDSMQFIRLLEPGEELSEEEKQETIQRVKREK